MGGAVDRIRNMFDFDNYDEYKGVDPKQHLNSKPSVGQSTDPDPATVDDK